MEVMSFWISGNVSFLFVSGDAWDGYTFSFFLSDGKRPS